MIFSSAPRLEFGRLRLHDTGAATLVRNTGATPAGPKKQHISV
jgi:hypothetical protein